MHQTFTYPKYAYRRPQELDGAGPARRPVVVVGAGPVGMAAAIDLRLHGLPVLLLDARGFFPGESGTGGPVVSLELSSVGAGSPSMR